MKITLFVIFFTALFLSACTDDNEKLEIGLTDTDLDEIIATDLDKWDNLDDLDDSDDLEQVDESDDPDLSDNDPDDEIIDEDTDIEDDKDVTDSDSDDSYDSDDSDLSDNDPDEDVVDEDINDDDIILPENVIYVKHDAAGLNDGTSWEDAFTDLSVAICSATEGKDIWVAAGIYHPTDCPNMYEECTVTTPQRKYHFELVNGVGIYGGFIGNETDISERDWENNETILSGDFNEDDDTAGRSENAYHVFYHDGWERKDNSAILDGFTISDGNADSAEWPFSDGAGIRFNKRSEFGATHITPIVRNCTFKNNSALDKGGAIYNHEGASPTIENCTFIDNSAQDGGAIHNYQGAPVIKDSTFTGNSATARGGAVGVDDSGITIDNCTFNDNTSDNNAGGVHLKGTEPMEVTNCYFNGNNAVNGGALVSHEADNVLVQGCYFVNNEAVGASLPQGLGGAVYNDEGSSLVVINSVFDTNSGVAGGAIFNLTAAASVINCSVSNSSGSGAIANGGSNPDIVNTIIYDNPGGSLFNVPEGTYSLPKSTPVIGYSNVEGCGGSGSDCGSGSDPCWVEDCGTDDGGNIDEDPLFVGTGDNPLDIDGLSPCVNAGDSAEVPVDVTQDIKGNARIQGIVDMGAYEHE